ncbi:histidine phosphatase superfamily [Aspergillus karnatakaensis]|uniref:acid phosphatase DET1 n=1 Tax=Aspergillus karnatakaensis TaxID=1810916 RepID=UPI003CCCD8E9
MGKPRMIILIRHAQSEGNKNRDIHQTIPDHRVKLTAEGHRQALEAGTRLRGLLRPDDKIHFFTSPYRRTRETTEGILESLTADTPSPSPFPRHTITVYEEPRLREQDFGNFQPCSAEMERMWLERADYGHFFYRIPNGESAADAYDRVSGFNESMWRLFGEKDFASVCVLVTHGLMTRVFLMKWYHWSVEYFEDLRNINHCEFVIMKLNEDSGKYVLQNQLRTWSELKREKEQERHRERAEKGLGPANPTPSETPVPIRRKWGGCPDGCDHGAHRKRSSRSHKDDAQHKPSQDHGHNQAKHQAHTDDPSTESASAVDPRSPSKAQDETVRAPEPALGDRSGDEIPLQTLPQKQNTRYLTPDRPTTPGNHPLNYSLIHLVGRDGGGTLSGANSVIASEDEHDHQQLSHNHNHTQEQIQQHEHIRAGLKRHKPRPSQDIDNDGDDEGSGRQTPKLRRTRASHVHTHHNSHPWHGHGHGHGHDYLPSTPARRRTSEIAAPDEDNQNPNAAAGQEVERENGYPSKEPIYEDESALEEAKREDQSIRGGVY